MLAPVGNFGQPLPYLAIHIVKIGKFAQRPKVLPKIADGPFDLTFGEKRVLQTVLMVAHKFSPSRIHSTH